MTKVIFVAWPEPTENPYIKLLIESLKRRGENLEVLFYSPKLLEKLMDNGEKFILHIHWPHICYPDGLGFLYAVSGAAKFIARILKSKNRGVKIVWTVHNYASHDYAYPIIDKLVYRSLFRLADNFIVHTEAGKNFLIARCVSPEKIFIIPHGNYIGVYGEKREKSESRKKLKLAEEDMVFLNLGLLRPYKRLDLLINVFQKFPDKKVKLIIAGRPLRIKIDTNKIKSATDKSSHLIARYWIPRKEFENSPNLYDKTAGYSKRWGDKIIIYNEYISPDEILTFLGASDFFILANKNMLSSGAVILALSYGVPLIAPRSGDAPHLIKDGENGFLYEPENLEALKNAIVSLSLIPREQRKKMDGNAIASVKNFSWDHIAKETLKVYRL